MTGAYVLVLMYMYIPASVLVRGCVWGYNNIILAL